MAEPRGVETRRPPPAPPPAPDPPGGRSRGRPPSLGRARREPGRPSSLRLSLGPPGGRRRGTLRELLGPQEPPEAAAAGGGPGGLCLEPGEHAWMLAAAEGRFEALLPLLEAEPTLLSRLDPLTGYGALHWLAKHGSHEGLILAQSWARSRGLPLDVNAAGSGGLTPLHLAAQQGHDLVLKVLVGALGADAGRRDHSGRRAWHYLRPDALPELRELAGADAAPEPPRPAAAAAAAPAGSLRRRAGPGNANNNCSRGGPPPPSGLSDGGASAPGDKGSRVTQIQAFFRQFFSLFQER